MTSLEYVIDSLCAKFTTASMCQLVKIQLGKGPATIPDLAREIAGSDRSLDIKSAEQLAQAAVQVLARRGEAKIQGTWVYPAAWASDSF